MSTDELAKAAEQDVISAAISWDRAVASAGRPLTTEEQQLRLAVYMLGRARHITGSIRVADIEDAMKK